MKSIVTGGAGFVGSNLALALQARGDKVIVVDNYSSARPENLSEFRGEVIQKDINDVDWEKFGSVDVIYHQAALTDTRVLDRTQMRHTNVEGFQKILSYATKHARQLVYASSAAVYGNLPAPQIESGPRNPLNVYGESKREGDQLAEKAIASGEIPIVGLRYFNVFGLGEQKKATFASMVYQLAEQMRQGKRPRIFTDGEQSRDHIYVQDVVEANLLAGESRRSGIVNVGTGKSTTFNELIRILNEALSTDLAPNYFENPYNFYQNETRAGTHAAETLLGFRARYSVRDGVRDYFSKLYGIEKPAKVNS